MNRHLLFLVLAAIVLVLSGGCASEYLETQSHYADQRGFSIDDEARISDTVDNRRVLDVLLQYRNAMVVKDFGTLKRLVSDDYYDNGGTTDTTEDDYGSGELDELYEMMANHAEEITYDVIVKSVEIDGDTASVDYEYEYAYQYKVGEKVTWDAGVEVNRLDLHNQQGDWKIVSGL